MPTGKVTVKQGNTVWGKEVDLVTGKATFSISLSKGRYAFTFLYDGDTNFTTVGKSFGITIT